MVIYVLNQEKVLVGVFTVITNLRVDLCLKLQWQWVGSSEQKSAEPLIQFCFQYEVAELEIKISDQMRDLYTDYRVLESQEKLAVRRIHFEVRKCEKIKCISANKK